MDDDKLKCTMISLADGAENMSTYSTKSKKTTKSKRKNSAKYHPYNPPSNFHYKNKKRLPEITTSDFFKGITMNIEIGRDFLREMDTPICTSKTIFLPLELSLLAPGRCIVLCPFGHTSNMSFDCSYCSCVTESQKNTFSATVSSQTNSIQLKENDELYSVALTFYNHSDKVVQHKSFYLSLLSHSMETVRLSFKQPGLIYGYVILKQFCQQIFPIFNETFNGLINMFIIFKSENLHIGETCLRLLTDKLPGYNLSIDCVRQTYILKFSPKSQEERSLTVPEDSICDAVSTLDYTDELKEEILNGSILVSEM